MKNQITYTYNGITFETSSKVVLSMWSRGKFESAYKRFLSDTTGRRMRGSGMSRKTRLNTLRTIEKTKDEKQAEAMKKTAEEAADKSRRLAEASRLKSMENWFSMSEVQMKATPATRRLLERIVKIITEENERYTDLTAGTVISRIEDEVTRFEQTAGPKDIESVQKVIETVKAEIVNIKYRPGGLRRSRKGRRKK